MLTHNNTLDSSISNKNRRSKNLPNECRICTAPADYSYFGVVSCQSCKMFFRRNANAGQTAFICVFDGQCEVNLNTRHKCASCRLAKCFKCGMSTDKFRALRPDKPKEKILVKVQPEKLPTLNLLSSDQSLLTSDQWTLLSNLFNTYKESQLLSISQRLVDAHHIITSDNTIYQSLVQEFLAAIYETTGAYIRSNNDLCKLSSNNRSIMLHNAADKVSCMGFAFVIHLYHLFSLTGFANAMIRMYGNRSVDLHLWAAKFIDSDIVLVKLALSLFALTEITYSYSPNASTELTNSIDILKIQNTYAEVIWKYLLYKYGRDQAVTRFLNITSWLTAYTVFMFHAQSITTHVNDVSSLVEQTELSLILDDVDQILETN